jgi:ABC-type phosphate transport system substrate-binding protein
MVAYNYPAAVAAGKTGSDAALNAASCRTDAFYGGDLPFTESELDGGSTTAPRASSLWGTPGDLSPSSCTLAFAPPFTPDGTPSGSNDVFPNSADHQADLMALPIAGSAIGIGVNIQPSATCANPPTQLNFTPAQISELLGGDYTNWSQLYDPVNNPGLAGCTTPITRVVGYDDSGTTQTIKNYLAAVDPNSADIRSCDTQHTANATYDGTWATLRGQSPDYGWPGLVNPGAASGTAATVTAGCSPIQFGTVPGSDPDAADWAAGDAAAINSIVSTDGAVGYADLNAWETPLAYGAVPADQLAVIAAIQSQDGSNFASPYGADGTSSACTFAGAGLPGTTATDAVGLNASNKNWALNSAPDKADIADSPGPGYPICGLEWDLVFAGLDNHSGTSAIAGLSADQRRTLYAYFTYIFAPAAQSLLGAAGYAALPSGWLPKLRAGFQEGF